MGEVITSFESNSDKRNKIGSETIIHFKDCSLNSICNYLVEEPYYKKINLYFSSCSNDNFLNHNSAYTLISNTLECSTIFVWECEYEHPEILRITSEALEEYKKNRVIFMKRFAAHLTKIAEYSQYESIAIDSTRKEIWDVITNWSTLLTICPYIVDEVEFNGDQLEAGSHIRLIYKTNRNVISDFRVTEVSNKDDGQDWEYRLVLNDSTPKLPYQEIRFNIAFSVQIIVS